MHRVSSTAADVDQMDHDSLNAALNIGRTDNEHGMELLSRQPMASIHNSERVFGIVSNPPRSSNHPAVQSPSVSLAGSGTSRAHDLAENSGSHPFFDETITQYVGGADLLDPVQQHSTDLDEGGIYDLDSVIHVTKCERDTGTLRANEPAPPTAATQPPEDNASVAATAGAGELSISRSNRRYQQSPPATGEIERCRLIPLETPPSRHSHASDPESDAMDLVSDIQESHLPRAKRQQETRHACRDTEVQLLRVELAIHKIISSERIGEADRKIAALQNQVLELFRLLKCRDTRVEHLQQCIEDSGRQLSLRSAECPKCGMTLCTPDLRLNADDSDMKDRDDVHEKSI